MKDIDARIWIAGCVLSNHALVGDCSEDEAIIKANRIADKLIKMNSIRSQRTSTPLPRVGYMRTRTTAFGNVIPDPNSSSIQNSSKTMPSMPSPMIPRGRYSSKDVSVEIVKIEEKLKQR